MKTWVKRLSSLALFGALLFGAALGFVSSLGDERHETKDSRFVDVTIKRGMGPRAISGLLEEKGIVDNDEDFYRYLRFIVRKTAALKSGDYRLAPSMTMDEIISTQGNPLYDSGRAAQIGHC